MAFRRPCQVNSNHGLFSFLIVSVLIIQITVSAPAPNNIDSRLDNPCTYNDHRIRHQRSANSQSNKSRHILTELRKVTNRTTRALQEMRQWYQNPKIPLSLPFQIKSKPSSKVDGYHTLQMFLKAIHLMSLQRFESTDSMREKDRSVVLNNLFDASTLLLCEMYDEIYVRNQTKDVSPVTKNKDVQSLHGKIPLSMERSNLITQDIQVLKEYRTFLKKLTNLYRQKKRRSDKNSKTTKPPPKGKNKKGGKGKGEKGVNNKRNKRKQRPKTS